MSGIAPGARIVARTRCGSRCAAACSSSCSCLTLAFGALYAWGVHELFTDVDEFGGNGRRSTPTTLAGATILGLAMFGTLFLGVVLATSSRSNAVRGDAERGLLQPMLVRPLGRGSYLLGALGGGLGGERELRRRRLLRRGVLLTSSSAGDTPDNVVVPALELAGAVAIISALALLGSIVLGTTANGMAVLMVFGAGLLVGLLGSIGDALDSGTLSDVGRHRLLDAAVRGPLPRRALPARRRGGRGRRGHRRARAARTARRLARQPRALPALLRRLRARGRRARAGRVPPPGPLILSGGGARRSHRP